MRKANRRALRPLVETVEDRIAASSGLGHPAHAAARRATSAPARRRSTTGPQARAHAPAPAAVTVTVAPVTITNVTINVPPTAPSPRPSTPHRGQQRGLDQARQHDRPGPPVSAQPRPLRRAASSSPSTSPGTGPTRSRNGSRA